MIRNCVAVVALCALALAGAMPGAMVNCARRITASGPACCLNEATCPMHHKSSDATGLKACHGARTDSPIVVVHHVAVLVTGVGLAPARDRELAFETSGELLLSPPPVPATPPPRLG